MKILKITSLTVIVLGLTLFSFLGGANSSTLPKADLIAMAGVNSASAENFMTDWDCISNTCTYHVTSGGNATTYMFDGDGYVYVSISTSATIDYGETREQCLHNENNGEYWWCSSCYKCDDGF